MIVERKVHLVFPKELLDRPLVYGLIQQFDLLTNILEARVTAEGGTMTIAVRGEQHKVEQGLAWMAEQGVQAQALPDTEEGICESSS